MKLSLSAGVAAALCCASVAAAQQVRGTVRDSASRTGIPGAVITVFGADRVTRGRVVTNAAGEYVLTPAPGAERVRVVRIGFGPVERALRGSAGDRGRLDIVMRALPRMLDVVRVQDNPNCSARPDRAAALALWEQAQAGLLAAVVGRETNPPRLVRARFERTMSGTTDRIEAQSVFIDTVAASPTSFVAARPAADFIASGFVVDKAGQPFYFAPDAETLLDDTFTSAYCLSVHARDPARPAQIGLTFEAARRMPNRIDIRGTLWLDTAARELRDIEYGYVGLAAQADRARPGGSVSFRAMANGQILVDRWSLRTPDAGIDTTRGSILGTQVRERRFASEGGGELIEAAWDDGFVWHAPRGILVVELRDSLDMATSAFELHLANTSYAGRPNARGVVEIHDLLTGPYSAVLVDSALATVGMTLPTSLQFVIENDSIVQKRLRIPNIAGLLRGECLKKRPMSPKEAIVVIRARTPEDVPLRDVSWQIDVNRGAGFSFAERHLPPEDDGVLDHCAHYAVGDELEVRVWRKNGAAVTVRRKLVQGINAIAITYPAPVSP